jgi:hypothetical protein
VVLLTAQEVDAAAKHSVEYHPPTEWQEAHADDGGAQGQRALRASRRDALQLNNISAESVLIT